MGDGAEAYGSGVGAFFGQTFLEKGQDSVDKDKRPNVTEDVSRLLVRPKGSLYFTAIWHSHPWPTRSVDDVAAPALFTK